MTKKYHAERTVSMWPNKAPIAIPVYTSGFRPSERPYMIAPVDVACTDVPIGRVPVLKDLTKEHQVICGHLEIYAVGYSSGVVVVIKCPIKERVGEIIPRRDWAAFIESIAGGTIDEDVDDE